MSRPDLLDRLAGAHAARTEQALLRRLRTVDAVSGCTVVIEGRPLLNFASNDYLGLAAHPRVIEALRETARGWGVGATAAHLLGGHRQAHAALEADLARWTGRERALLFSTGYMANLGVLQALLARDDLCVQDRLNHACLLDGARLSGCELKRYLHADVDSARQQLGTRAHAGALLATDGVFSMDGDVAPLRALAELCTREQATLMVDDAHGIGVLGAHGAGSVVEAGLTSTEVPVVMATLGKALGVGGAFVAGSAALIDGLVQFARTHIYTTAMPPALAAAATVAVQIARDDDDRRAHLQLLIAGFRDGCAARGIALHESRTPIQPVVIGRSEDALATAAHLEAAGFFVPAIRPPTVPDGSARLRVTLSAAHTVEDVDRLLDALQAAIGNTQRTSP